MRQSNKETVNGKCVPKIILEKHVSLVEELDSRYLGHTTKENGFGKWKRF